MESRSKSYEKAGVNITAGYEAVRRMQKHIQKTTTPQVLSGIGGFSGLYSLEKSDCGDPVLVSGTDGVGTKLKLAFFMNKHDTIGIDCVAMCVNDIVCSGARPLFFLDYIATGKNIPSRIEEIVSGVAEGCVQAGCALIGGETAEMPGFYSEDEYDLAGFSVGIVQRGAMLDRSLVREGDLLIGLRSSGVHSNGFSLVRRVFDLEHSDCQSPIASLGKKSVCETLLTPTMIYVKPILDLARADCIKSAAHITGGGFYENIPRSLPQGLSARIDPEALPVLPIFDLIQHTGKIPQKDMYNTFNMGIGMTVTVSPEKADQALAILRQAGQEASVIGEIVSSEEGVIL